MKTATYYKDSGGKEKVEIEYDENASCIICGEPVISASMGGTVICPWCDLGKCRYCGVTIHVYREELDGGHSKKNLLEHMKWHRERQPDFNSKLLEIYAELEKKLKEEKEVV